MHDSNDAEENVWMMLVGIILLLCSLVVSAGLGIYQEKIFSEYGNQSSEALFYNVSAYNSIF